MKRPDLIASLGLVNNRTVRRAAGDGARAGWWVRGGAIYWLISYLLFRPFFVFKTLAFTKTISYDSEGGCRLDVGLCGRCAPKLRDGAASSRLAAG